MLLLGMLVGILMKAFWYSSCTVYIDSQVSSSWMSLQGETGAVTVHAWEGAEQ